MTSISLIFTKANPFLDDFNYSILTLNKLIIIIMIERSTREREREREREDIQNKESPLYSYAL